MWSKVLLGLIAALMLFAFGIVAGWLGHRILPGGAFMHSSPVILTRVQNLRQLVTVKYYLEKVVTFDDPAWIAYWHSDSRVIMVAHGVVKAGIDLDSLKPGDIQVSDKHIRIQLPEPRLTDVYLDDTQTEVMERSTGLLRKFDKNLEQNARIIALGELRKAAVQNGILRDAGERARTTLTSLLYGLGFTSVDIRGLPEPIPSPADRRLLEPIGSPKE